jgi:guanylate kinase
MPSTNQKIVIITAPSGSGKTTMVKRLLAATDKLSFSISACTRQPRAGEVDGKDYYFYNEDAFRQMIDADAFVEWEMVYAGKYYGTPKTELARIWNEGKYPLVDIDVMGAIAVMNKYREQCLTIFIKPPSIETLRERLTARGTETSQSLEERVQKAQTELTYAGQFDKIIVNDNLDIAAQELINAVTSFIS